MKNSLLKSIRFNMDDEHDKLMYDWLSRLPRGEFSSRTKQFWKNEMNMILMPKILGKDGGKNE
ncbi:MAG: hypothetical protein JWM44_1556 [Bacilli bacterium]|nr:hypothetical protein [Bacilli bacterium]